MRSVRYLSSSAPEHDSVFYHVMLGNVSDCAPFSSRTFFTHITTLKLPKLHIKVITFLGTSYFLLVNAQVCLSLPGRWSQERSQMIIILDASDCWCQDPTEQSLITAPEEGWRNHTPMQSQIWGTTSVWLNSPYGGYIVGSLDNWVHEELLCPVRGVRMGICSAQLSVYAAVSRRHVAFAAIWLRCVLI
jgi:hypothetical protein